MNFLQSTFNTNSFCESILQTIPINKICAKTEHILWHQRLGHLCDKKKLHLYMHYWNSSARSIKSLISCQVTWHLLKQRWLKMFLVLTLTNVQFTMAKVCLITFPLLVWSPRILIDFISLMVKPVGFSSLIVWLANSIAILVSANINYRMALSMVANQQSSFERQVCIPWPKLLDLG